MSGSARGAGPTAARKGAAALAALALLPALLAGCGEREVRDAGTGATDTAVAVRPDSPAKAEAGKERPTRADTAPAGRYYVRVRASADPREVAARHGIEPLDVITEPTKAFYAALTYAQRDALQADTLVRSLAREIH